MITVIADEETARNVVDLLADYLVRRENERREVPYPEAWEPGDPEPGYSLSGDEPKHWDLAAEWAKKILNASGRDNWSGCSLCRS